MIFGPQMTTGRITRKQLLTLCVWLCLVTAYIAQQASGPGIVDDLCLPVPPDGPKSGIVKSDAAGIPSSLPTGKQLNVPKPAERKSFFKWKQLLPERFVIQVPVVNKNRELAIDVCRCRTVACTLFPFHAFP